MEPIKEPIKNNKEELPLEFYIEKYKTTDPYEIAARCPTTRRAAPSPSPCWAMNIKSPTPILL